MATFSNEPYASGCTANVENTGTGAFCEDFSKVVSFIRTPYDFAGFATETLAKTKSSWDDAIVAPKGNRIYPFEKALNFEQTAGESVTQEGSVQVVNVSKGNVEFKFTLICSSREHNVYSSHDWAKSGIYLRDSLGRIQGVRGENDEFKPFKLSNFDVGSFMQNTGSERGSCVITMTIENVYEYNHSKVAVKPDFDAQDLVGVTSLWLSLVLPEATSVTIDVTYMGNNQKRLLGLSTTPDADFKVWNSSGALQTPTTITEASDGLYEISFSSPLPADTYRVELADANVLSLQPYEGVNIPTFTIP